MDRKEKIEYLLSYSYICGYGDFNFSGRFKIKEKTRRKQLQQMDDYHLDSLIRWIPEENYVIK